MTDEEFEQSGREIIGALRALSDHDFQAIAQAVNANDSVRKCCSDGHVLVLTPTDYCDTKCEHRGGAEASSVYYRLRELRVAEGQLRAARAAAAALRSLV